MSKPATGGELLVGGGVLMKTLGCFFWLEADGIQIVWHPVHNPLAIPLFTKMSGPLVG